MYPSGQIKKYEVEKLSSKRKLDLIDRPKGDNYNKFTKIKTTESYFLFFDSKTKRGIPYVFKFCCNFQLKNGTKRA